MRGCAFCLVSNGLIILVLVKGLFKEFVDNKMVCSILFSSNAMVCILFSSNGLIILVLVKGLFKEFVDNKMVCSILFSSNAIGVHFI